MARSISVGCQRVGTSSFGLNLGRRAFMGALSAPALAHASSWGEFLGNGSLSLGGETAVPLAWGDQQNLAWRAQTPGYGQSAPVVAGSKAFVTCVEGPNKETLLVSAIDTESGEVAWSHRSASSQRIEDSNMVSKAAPTGTTYDDSIFTFFETGNILALNQDGTLRWERSLTEEFGEFGGRHGIGSSLRRCRAGILALVAHDRPSYLICLNPEDGTTVWKADRPEGVSWSTPTVVEHDGNELALVSAGDTVEAYDTSNGARLWTLDGLEGAFIASPTPVPGGAVIGSSAKGAYGRDPVWRQRQYAAGDRLAGRRGLLVFQFATGTRGPCLHGEQGGRSFLPQGGLGRGSLAHAACGPVLGIPYWMLGPGLLLRCRWGDAGCADRGTVRNPSKEQPIR